MPGFASESYAMHFNRNSSATSHDIPNAMASPPKEVNCATPTLKKTHLVLQNLFNLNDSKTKVLVIGLNQVNYFKPFVTLKSVHNEGITVSHNTWSQLMKEIKIVDACLREDVTPQDISVENYTVTTYMHQTKKLICLTNDNNPFQRVCLGCVTVTNLIRYEDAIKSVLEHMSCIYVDVHDFYLELLKELKTSFEHTIPALNKQHFNEVTEFVHSTLEDYDIVKNNQLNFDNLRLFHEMNVAYTVKHLNDIL